MRLFLSLLLLVTSLFLATPSFAQEYTDDYKAEYFLTTEQGKVQTRVRFTVTLTHLRSDVYVKKILLAFPKSFEINNLSASDDKGKITPDITTDERKYLVNLEFNDPEVGTNSKNHFYLEFDQNNLFKNQGNVWEVILPTIEDDKRKNYQIVVHLPENTDRKISIAKPKPTQITGKTIIWNNPQSKTVYAIFGDAQYYQTKLSYHLQNPKVIPVYTEVAFPPDTLYQRTYINSIEPKPSSVSIDEDGNYLGRYYLKPRENLTVTYNGLIELFNHPRPEMQPIIAGQFAKQKEYLLTEKSYWKIGTPKDIIDLKTPNDIYNYVANKFSYNYERVNQQSKRLGAELALQYPDQAVCVEFSDTFIGIAREKGIYSREIQGYGFSHDPQLRPLSKSSDVLHSWPEYFDTHTGLWNPVDPTWENTSGIDYFNSFDLNHITFAIHGKRPDYPVPAGSYKTEETKDIEIMPVTEKPLENVKIQLDTISFPDRIVDNANYKLKLTVMNGSNVFALNTSVRIESDLLKFSEDAITIPLLAPYEKREIFLDYASRVQNTQKNTFVKIYLLDSQVFYGKSNIIPYYYELGLKIGYIIVGFSVLFFLLRWINLRQKSPVKG